MVEQEKDRRRHWNQICCEFRCEWQKFLNASEAHLASSIMAIDVALAIDVVYAAMSANNRILKRSDGDRCTHNLCCESIRLRVGDVLHAKPSKRIWIGNSTHPNLFYYPPSRPNGFGYFYWTDFSFNGVVFGSYIRSGGSWKWVNKRTPGLALNVQHPKPSLSCDPPLAWGWTSFALHGIGFPLFLT